MELVMQKGTMDCGIAAINMIFNSLGIHIPYNVIRGKTNLTDDGISIFELEKIAANYKLDAVALEGSCKEFFDSIKNEETKLPCIARISNPEGKPHYVVVNSISKDENIIVYDPAIGKYKQSEEQFKDIFLGQIIYFKKKPDFVKVKAENHNPFFHYVKEVVKKPINIFMITVIMIISAVTTSLSLMPAFLMNYITNEVSTTGNSETIEVIALMITFAVVSLFIGYVLKMFQGKMTVNLVNTMMKKQFQNTYSGLIRRSLNFFNNVSTGDIQERFLDSTKISNTVLQLLFSVFSIVMMLVSGVMMSHISIPVLLVSIATFIISLIVALGFNHTLTVSAQETAIASANTIDYLRETGEGILTIKALNGENDFKNNFFSKIDDLKNAIGRSAVKNIRKDAIFDIIQAVGLLAIIWISVVEISLGNMQIGNLVLISTLYSYFLSPADSFSDLYAQIIEATVESERLEEMSECEENTKTIKNEDIKDGSIKVTNLSFGYRPDKNIINNISFYIEDKSCVAIVGESGRGKSTLAKLIAGIEDEDKGNIFIGGSNIRNINDKTRTANLQYIPQFPYFVNDTYRNNLLIGINDNNIHDNEIYTVLRNLGADFVTNLDDMITENGNNLSGGQKQKLALARSILRNPKILIMDESTSSIDAEGQELILKYIETLKCTKVIISHDEKVIDICNRKIYV